MNLLILLFFVGLVGIIVWGVFTAMSNKKIGDSPRENENYIKNRNEKVIIGLVTVVLIFQFVLYNKLEAVRVENESLKNNINGFKSSMQNMQSNVQNDISGISDLLKSQYQTVNSVKWDSQYVNGKIVLRCGLLLNKKNGGENVLLHYKSETSDWTTINMQNSSGLEYNVEFEAQADAKYEYQVEVSGEVTEKQLVPEYLNKHEAYFLRSMNPTLQNNNQIVKTKILAEMSTKPYLKELSVNQLFINIFDDKGNQIDKIDFIERVSERVGLKEETPGKDNKLMIMAVAGDLYIDFDGTSYSEPINKITYSYSYFDGHKSDEIVFYDDGKFFETK